MSGNRFSAVIFDFDGLLVDSEPVQIAAWERYLERFGVSLTDDVLASMYGRRLSDASAAAVEMLQLPVSPEEVARDRDEIFLETVPGNIHAKPGAVTAVQWVSAQGIPLALATSGHRRYIDLALDSAGIPRLFDAEITGELVSHGKPDPETFLRAAEALGYAPGDCVVVEDSPNGVMAAKRAGAFCIAVPDGPEHRDLLTGADVVLDSLLELPAFLYSPDRE
ncbi:MAG: HAD family hydrolase [Chloroflexota bacterium]